MKTMQRRITAKKCSSVLTIPKKVLGQGRVHISFHVDVENEILCHELEMPAVIFLVFVKLSVLKISLPHEDLADSK